MNKNSKLQLLLILSIIIGTCLSFTPSKDTVFLEDFQGTSSRWVNSQQAAYNGIVEIRASVDPIDASDKGLVLTQKAKKYAITSKLIKPVDNKGRDLVIQYEVKLQTGLDCGGAYIKLYSYSDNFESENVDEKTPYSIMFGPDKCGQENRIHFIVRAKNPLTGEHQEKLITARPPIRIDKIAHLYTLHIKPDNTFSIFVDGVSVLDGDFHKDFTPAFNPPKEIDDPSDKKPSTWVDEETIKDPEATKPEDWDETQPARIEDPEAVKPDDWQDNEPELVPSDETQPEEWNEEDDGEWEAPLIQNPKCSLGNCGEWKAPLIENPLYKGIWSHPMIPNPEYIGEWKPKQIPNPDYFEVENPYIVEPIGAVGIEVWTMSQDILFDNFIITHDKSEADKFASETFYPKHKLEEERQAAKEAAEAAEMDPSESFVDMALSYFNIIQEQATTNPLILVVSVSALILPIVFCMTRSSPKKPVSTPAATKVENKVEKKQESSSEEEEEEEEEEQKTSVKKRTNKVK
ncbi:hypothetical protein CYY_007127 [Polysphondylium violaceum]|uniref:Calnexin n=1 Tax=Polysphondylium violaceum TaxID=133409 RepID=A0A8J4PRE1_9MYCE|nr:hypothetical protein CYY_007127 [Polysphondylium violaceum]